MVMIINIRTDRSGQTVSTQIRQILKELPHQALHCLSFQEQSDPSLH